MQMNGGDHDLSLLEYCIYKDGVYALVNLHSYASW